MAEMKFEKDYDNRWYVVLPEWEGSIDELEMVSGADVFLDILSQGSEIVRAKVEDKEFEEYQYKLEFVKHADGGGDYHLISDLFEFPVWLCHITKFIFGYLPEKIYISKLYI